MKPTLRIDIAVEKEKEGARMEIIPSNNKQPICACNLSGREEAIALVKTMQVLNQADNYSFLRRDNGKHYFELRENNSKIIIQSRDYSGYRNAKNARDFFMITIKDATVNILTVEVLKL